MCAIPTEAAFAAGWSAQATAAPTGAKLSALYGVSCPSSRACTAVGEFIDGSSEDTPLASRWNPSGWTSEQTPGLAVGVSCASSSSCLAVGTVAERWNGVSWSLLPTPSPPNAVYGGVLRGVSCTSADMCAAVGSFENHKGEEVTLAERWNGSHWSVQPTPNPAGGRGSHLMSVSCSSRSKCIAVGTFNGARARLTPGSRPLSERWDGRRWSMQWTPSPAGASSVELNGVSCASPVACAAVGSYIGRGGRALTLAERWNGRRWSIERTPSRGQVDALAGVSCPSKTVCMAVGNYVNGVGMSRTLAERWSAGRWSIEATPNPPGASFSSLQSVSCPSSSLCAAAGFSDSGMLAERYS